MQNKKPKTQIFKDKYGRIIKATFDSYNVRINIDDKKVEEIITKDSFYRRMEAAKWEQIG